LNPFKKKKNDIHVDIEIMPYKLFISYMNFFLFNIMDDLKKHYYFFGDPEPSKPNDYVSVRVEGMKEPFIFMINRELHEKVTSFLLNALDVEGEFYKFYE
jgi:hypothetical protein